MYDLDGIKVILAKENNAILHKKLHTDMLNMEKIIVSHSLVYIKSGTVEIETYDYQKFSASEGEMLFMPKDSYLISDYIKSDKEMEVYLFFFDHTIASEFLAAAPAENRVAEERILKCTPSDNIICYIDALKSVEYAYKDNEHLLKTKLFELLHLIVENSETFLDVLSAQEETKTDIETYMLEHYDKNLSVSDWAALCGYSLSTFNRKFKRRYDLSPKQWILRQNMRLAADALKCGQSVTQCASEFGYENSSNFIKAFKQVYKTTPKQYSMT